MAKEAVAEKSEFNAARLAKDLGIQEASVRVALRKHEVEKEGKAYVWPTKKAYEEVLAKLKSVKPEKKAEKKPAKKAASKKQ